MNCVRISHDLCKASSLVPGTRQELSHSQLEVADASIKASIDNVTGGKGLWLQQMWQRLSLLFVCSDAPFIMVMDYFKFKVHSTYKEK